MRERERENLKQAPHAESLNLRSQSDPKSSAGKFNRLSHPGPLLGKTFKLHLASGMLLSLENLKSLIV